MKYLKSFSLVLVSIIFLLFFTSLKIPKSNNQLRALNFSQDSTKWIVPSTANDLSNPYEITDENMSVGEIIYKKTCRSCHGRHGDGHGVESEDLTTKATDFTNASFVKQTDGSMFWKISEGRNDMKAYNKKLDEEDIWLVIMYIKTFSNSDK